MTLIINSDCSSLSSRNGFTASTKNQEIFKIKKIPVEKVSSEIDFPNWLHGQWQNLNVQRTQLIFRDQSSFKTYRMSLVNQLSDDKFIVLSRSQCGEESFKCLSIRSLDKNILEFQMSSESAKKLTNFMLCNDEHFDDKRWLTLSSNFPSFIHLESFFKSKFIAGTGSDAVTTACPIDGTYFGRLPDDLELCSMMTSKCNSDIMHFQIGPCDSSEVYEKRIYRCLGQWTDKDRATVYTFTKRVDDVDTYECFVGLMAGSEKQIIIREAGESCFKMLEFNNYGMEMNQTGEFTKSLKQWQ